jgi:hypothetical protein
VFIYTASLPSMFHDVVLKEFTISSFRPVLEMKSDLEKTEYAGPRRRVRE